MPSWREENHAWWLLARQVQVLVLLRPTGDFLGLQGLYKHTAKGFLSTSYQLPKLERSDYSSSGENPRRKPVDWVTENPRRS